jgi:hypothetical protein
MSDRTYEIVRRQAFVMDAKFFEVGLVKPATTPGIKPVMLTQTWSLDELLDSIPWLKSQNADDRNIYIRPAGKHALTLLNDLTADTLERMRHSGFTPAVIVETSPDNSQAWLNHGRSLSTDMSMAGANALAAKFNADANAVDKKPFGRLVGFENRSPRHRQPGGHYPMVRLVHATGEIYDKADQFLAEVKRSLRRAA